MSKIKAVISDFGGVLTSPLVAAFSAFQSDTGLPLEVLREGMHRAKELHGQNPLHTLERGEMTEVEFTHVLESAIRDVTGQDLTLGSFGNQYIAQLDPNQQLIDRLRTLKGEGYRLALLTNNVREWEQMWRKKLPVDELFEVVVDSAFVGVRKPDPEIYQITLQRLALAPEQCIFIDDLKKNCEAAEKLGIHAIHFKDNQQTINRLNSLLING